MEISTKKLYKTKEGRSFILLGRDETNSGLLDTPWPYCMQSLDTGSKIWCTPLGMDFLFHTVENLEEDSPTNE